jgi:hypothetical protein
MGVDSSMEEISVTGGARIGLVNATWPLAKLSASAASLRLSSLVGTYDFLPSDVVSLERYGLVPFFSNGVRIAHARSDYPSKIIFWCLGNPETLIQKIRQIGFLPGAPASSETRWRGIPVRVTPIVLFILIWNGLFYLDGVVPGNFAKRLGLFALFPLLFAFLVSWAAKTSPRFQEVILRDGHSVNEIKAYLSLVQMVSGILLPIFSILVLTHAFG